AVSVAQAAPTSEDAFTKLEKLAKLKEQGIISEEEFELKKKEILSQV
ncbi:SHOCT domain-containing protein, partial [Clostridium perfringens]